MTPGNRKKRPCDGSNNTTGMTMTTPVRSQKKRRIATCAHKCALITPVRAVQTEIKPPRQLQQQQLNTPHRITVPSLQSHRKNHRYGTPVSSSKAFGATGGDRFIPNRAKTDVMKAQHALTSSKKNRASESSSDDKNGAEYQRELRRVLFGENQNSNDKDDPVLEDENHCLLSFGASSTATKTPSRPLQDPMELDSLRRSHKNNGKSRPPKVNFQRVKALEAKDMVDNVNLSLLSFRNSSYGDDQMCIAIKDRVWVSSTTGEGVDILAEKEPVRMENGRFKRFIYSTVQWSEAGDLVALGTKDSIEIWCPSVSGNMRDEHLRFRDIKICKGFVTAIAWKETEIIAAGADGIKRIDLCEEGSKHMEYHHSHEDNLVTALEWKDHWIVSAGGDTINVFRDDKISTLPCLVLKHARVKTVEFCPFQSNLLVSGGDDGLKFWNIYNGSLRATIKTKERVVGTVFLKEHKEVAVAHGNTVSLWGIGWKPTKLCEITEGGTRNFVTMTGNEKGSLACAGIHVDDGESAFVSVFEISRTSTGGRHLFVPDMGSLQMPVIR